VAKRIVLGVCVVALIGGVAATGSEKSTAATDRSYVTFMIGRAQWAAVGGDCKPFPGAVPLDEVARDLAARGLAGTLNVVPDRTKETGFMCWGKYALQPGWDRVVGLRRQGWSVVSAGQSYKRMPTLTLEQQRAESCGSLDAFAARGIDASPLFAYPANKYTDEIQRKVVNKCFRFGRRYGGTINTRANLVAPWYVNVRSINGGRCRVENQPCSNAATRFKYTDPAKLQSAVQRLRGGWIVVQFYRLVRGAYATPYQQWDCTSPDPMKHWTNQSEVYCYDDFLRVVDTVVAERNAGRVQSASVDEVADTWGIRVTP
jgi:hypothetical protein